jgi:hypothetical protein
MLKIGLSSVETYSRQVEAPLALSQTILCAASKNEENSIYSFA